jgi:cation diffusion facilitator CzcD-associated flavoprotein CzcO
LDAAPASLNNVVVAGGGIQAVDRALGLLEAGSATHVTLISSSRFLPQVRSSAASDTSLATTVRRLSDQRPTYGTGLQFVRYLATVR